MNIECPRHIIVRRNLFHLKQKCFSFTTLQGAPFQDFLVSFDSLCRMHVFKTTIRSSFHGSAESEWWFNDDCDCYLHKNTMVI